MWHKSCWSSVVRCLIWLLLGIYRANINARKISDNSNRMIISKVSWYCHFKLLEWKNKSFLIVKTIFQFEPISKHFLHTAWGNFKTWFRMLQPLLLMSIIVDHIIYFCCEEARGSHWIPNQDFTADDPSIGCFGSSKIPLFVLKYVGLHWSGEERFVSPFLRISLNTYGKQMVTFFQRYCS